MRVRIEFKLAEIDTILWNRNHPERYVPWEWVEEYLIAWCAAKEKAAYAPREAAAHYARLQEFARKLPLELVTTIFMTQ